MRILSPEEARRLRNTLEEIDKQALADVIARTVATGGKVIIGGMAVPERKRGKHEQEAEAAVEEGGTPVQESGQESSEVRGENEPDDHQND